MSPGFAYLDRVRTAFERSLVQALLGFALLPSSAFAHLTRPDAAEDEPLQYRPTDEIERWDAPQGRVRMHFTRRGINGVTPDDLDSDQVPDRVQRLGALYEEAFARWSALGFRAPLDDARPGSNDGGDGRFDVYLLDVRPTPGGYFEERCREEAPDQCTGFIMHPARPGLAPLPDRTFVGLYGFIATIAAYHAHRSPELEQGSALWAASRFDPEGGVYEGVAQSFLETPHRGFEDAGSFQRMAVFLRYLERASGVELLRALWESLADPAVTGWAQALDRILEGGAMAAIRDFYADLWTQGPTVESLSRSGTAEVFGLGPYAAQFFVIQASSQDELRGLVAPANPARLVLLGPRAEALREGPLVVEEAEVVVALINTSDDVEAKLTLCVGEAKARSRCEAGEANGCRCAGAPPAWLGLLFLLGLSRVRR